MDKNSYPLVVVYNGRDHYVPTKLTTPVHYYEWKTQKELAPILSAGLLVLEEMDLKFLSQEQVDACNELEACIVKHLPTLSPQVNAAHHAMVARAPGSRGPSFSHQPSALKVPPPPAQPPSSSGTTSATPQPAEETQPPPGSQEKRQGRAKYICDICGATKSRKPALVGHMWSAHQMGDPIVCNIAPCVEHSFSTQSSLKKHVKTVHNKIYRWKCPDCYWGSDDKQEYITHRKRKHKMSMRNKQTKEKRVFRCSKCLKKFDGPNLLRKHKKRGTCMVQKKHQCETCLKFYITPASRDAHIKQHHTPGAKTWVCSICARVCNSLSAHLNHALWHRGLTALHRARLIRQRRVQTDAMKQTSAHIAKKLPHLSKKPRKPVPPKVPKRAAQVPATDVTQSAPPKIILRRSPRKKPAKKGSKK